MFTAARACSAPFLVPLWRWHLTAEEGSLGRRSVFSFLVWTGDLLRVRLAELWVLLNAQPCFKAARDSHQILMTGFLGVVYHTNTSKFIQLICPFGPKVWDIVEKNALLCVRSPLLASKGSLRKLLCQFQVTAELLSHFFCWEAFCHIRCLPVCFGDFP